MCSKTYSIAQYKVSPSQYTEVRSLRTATSQRGMSLHPSRDVRTRKVTAPQPGRGVYLDKFPWTYLVCHFLQIAYRIIAMITQQNITIMCNNIIIIMRI